mgnify:CR=1 FL=1
MDTEDKKKEEPEKVKRDYQKPAIKEVEVDIQSLGSVPTGSLQC